MQKVKISELHLWAKNPRTIKDKRFEALCKSLTDDPSFMELRPILATKDGRIYAGNMRYRAAQHLGWTEVPAIITDIPEKLANERAIKDNNEFGDWNHDELATLLDEMEKQGTDISTLGLDEQINKIIEQLNEKEIVEDEVPAVKKDPQTVLGDLWILGSHRLLCGDATKIDDVEKLMNGEKADMVFTDPPYGVSYTGGLQDNGKGLKSGARQMIKNDDVDLYEAAVKTASNFCVGPVFMFYADTVPFGLYRGIEQVGAEVVALIIWKKKGGYGALGASYKLNHEPCVIWKQKKHKLNFIGKTTENRVWEEDKEFVNKLHPTQKPVSIPERAIKNHDAPNVLDLFGGSGSTLIACEQLNRKCFMMELDPQYVRVIIDRWEKLTGKKAVLQ